MNPNNPNLIPMPEIEEENEFLKEVATYVGNKDDYFNYDGYTLVENECIFFSLLVALANHNEYIPLLKDYNLDIFKEFFDSKPKNYTQKCENIYKNTLLPLIEGMKIKTPGEIVLKFISLHFDELKALYMYIPNVKGTLNDFKSSLLSVCQRLTSNMKEKSLSLTPKDYLSSLSYEKRNYIKLYAKLYTRFSTMGILSLDDGLDFQALQNLSNYIVKNALDGKFTVADLTFKALNIDSDYDKLQNGGEIEEKYFLDLIKSGFSIETFKSLEELYNKDFSLDKSILHYFIKKMINIASTKPEKKQDVIVVESKQEKIDYDEFYDNISLELIGFLNYTGKIYTFLLNQYNEKKLSRLVVKDKSELPSLAVLLASFNEKYSDNYLSKFYIHNNISFDSIIDFCGLKREEIYNIFNSNVDDYSNHKDDDVNLFNFKAVYYAYSELIKRSFDYTVEDFIRRVVSNNDLSLIRLYSLKTGISVNVHHLNDKIGSYNSDIEKKEYEAYKKKFKEETSVDVYHLLQLACPYYDSLYEHLDIDEDKAVFALLYALFDQYEFDVSKYLNNYEINAKTLDEHLNFVSPEVSPRIDYKLVKDVFSKYMSGLDERFSVTKIIQNALKSNSILVKEFLEANGLSESTVTEENVNKYIKDKEKVEEDIALRDLINDYDLEGERFRLFNFSTKVYNYLSSLKDVKNLESEEFKVESSIFIAYLLSDNYPRTRVLEKYGVTLDAVLDYLGIKDKENFINNVNNTKDNPYLFLDYDYKNYIKEFVESETFKEYDFETAVTLEMIYSNTLCEDIFNRAGTIGYEDFENEVISGKEKSVPLTKEQIIEKLKNTDIDEEVSDDVYSVLTFGDSLSKNTTLIVDELTELLSSNSVDNTLEELSKEVNGIYKVTPAVIKEKTFADKLFRRSGQVIEPEKKALNLEAVKEIQGKIVENIDTLNMELKSFDYIRKYYELYIAKLDRYIKKLEVKIEESKKKLEESSKKDPNSNETVNYSTLVKLLETKLNYFLASRSTAAAEFVKTHQAIQNHFVTIQNLITAHDVLLPLLGNEILLALGKGSEIESNELASNVVNVLQTFLSKNVEDTKRNIEALNDPTLSKETIDKLKKDLDLYMSASREIDKKLESDENAKILSVKGGN